MPLTEDAQNFLKYPFTETKDLAEHFLTVVTAVLVFSLTFSEKIANFNSAKSSVRWTITVAWCCMLLAIVGGGVSICYVALAGGAASGNGPPEQYWSTMNTGIFWLGSAGLLFVLGLVSLLTSTLQTAWKSETTTKKTSPSS
jgi:H+/Cl- antiporter ClcA